MPPTLSAIWRRCCPSAAGPTGSGGGRPALPAITMAIISALVLFGGNVAALYVGRILNGLGIGLGARTGTAWLAKLIGKEDKTRATAIPTSANFLGLGVGALISGLLAQYTPWPLQLPSPWHGAQKRP